MWSILCSFFPLLYNLNFSEGFLYMKLLLLSFAILFGSSAFSANRDNALGDLRFDFAAPVVYGVPSTPDPVNPVGSIVYDISTNTFKGLFNSGWGLITQGSSTSPTVHTYTSGTGSWSRPSGCLYIKVKMVGGGGGGGASGTASFGSASAGGASSFATLAAGGGGAGSQTTSATGGTASLGSGPLGTVIAGARGGGASFTNLSVVQIWGGMGGATPFSGAGGGGTDGAAGTDAVANSGSGGGGGGGGSLANTYSGSGGSAGGYVEAIISNFSAAPFSYAVGSAGSGASAGTSGSAGGNGSAGYIVVEEYYQ
jgi:hypothetical protein